MSDNLQPVSAAEIERMVEEKKNDFEARLRPAEPKYVSKEDRLEVDNLHLRVLLVAHETTGLQRQIQQKQAELQDLNKQILKKKAELEERYGVDLTENEIRAEDGAIVPRGQNTSFKQVLAKAKE